MVRGNIRYMKFPPEYIPFFMEILFLHVQSNSHYLNRSAITHALHEKGKPMVSITVCDGANGIGGNKIFLEEGEKGIFLDFGRNYIKYGMYYEDFFKNRDTRGIHDLLYLDLVPKLNIYRNDLIPADTDLSFFPRLNVAAVFLSYAHLDQSGNIGLIKKEIPIVASPNSLAIMKGMQDSGMPNLDN